MIKVCIFNKSNDVSRFNIFKKLFECSINSDISLARCTETGAVYFGAARQRYLGVDTLKPTSDDR